MFKNILNTVFVRVLNGFFSFLIVVINSKSFGAEGLGTIGLIVLAISIFVLINSLIGGGTFLYFVPKINNFKLFIISYLWTLVSLIIFVLLIQFVNLAPPEYLRHIIILAVFFSFTGIIKSGGRKPYERKAITKTNCHSPQNHGRETRY